VTEPFLPEIIFSRIIMTDNERFIFETKHWSVILAEEQAYFGYCVVVLKRQKCGDLAEVTEEELVDFLHIVKRFESALRGAFDATMFNWTCLMNNAYREKEPKPQVHWHVKPRYNHKVEFAGEVFEDPNFGNHYLHFEEVQRAVSEEVADKIIKKIQDKLPL
jgi:diadenosine tetraphosphate (Ap4A) HIT family hydrolase